MAVETDLRDYLLADSAVAALVATRIYPLKATAGSATPFITYFKSQTTPLGTLADADKVVRHVMNIDAWATTYQSAKDVADAVKDALDGLSAIWTDGEVAVRFSDMSDEYDNDASLYTIKTEVTILQQ